MSYNDVSFFASRFADMLSDKNKDRFRYEVYKNTVAVEMFTTSMLLRILTHGKDVIDHLNKVKTTESENWTKVERTIITPHNGPILVIYEFS